jgi:VIT1/CCC1 family predicted Fe2+/Mn2+ transporter
MNHSTKVGLSFGLTSGVITTLGLMVGLGSSTESKLVVLGGIITIAIADAFSDALGIHISEEAENKHTSREIWQSTIATFLAKFIFALTFAVPVILFNLNTAVAISVAWGLLVLGFFSYIIAKNEKVKPIRVIVEHIGIAVLVVVVTYFVGRGVGLLFG